MNKTEQHIMIVLEKNKDRWLDDEELKDVLHKVFPKANYWDIKTFMKNSIDVADSWNQEEKKVEYRFIEWGPEEREKMIEDLEWFDSLPD